MSTQNVWFREERNISQKCVHTTYVFVAKHDKYFPEMSTHNVRFRDKQDKYFLEMSIYNIRFREETRHIFPWKGYLWHMFSWRNKTNISLKWVTTTHVFVKKQYNYFLEMSTPNVCFREETRQIFPGNEYTQRVFSWRNKTNISLKFLPTTYVFVKKQDKYFPEILTYNVCFREETRQIFPWNKYLQHTFS